MLMFPLMFAVLYFVVILPSQRQRKAQQQMQNSLKAGDEVATTGGIVGSVVSLADATVVIRVKPDNVKLQVARTAVATLINAESK
ncbi:MAG: preprotein translocase subunit YajC [Acidobacteria bacterium]|nr:preprotein translocase subunit YajC [Acidobacteriota bacterium]